jgi:hypothetical protein
VTSVPVRSQPWDRDGSAAPTRHDQYADIVEALFAEYESALPLRVILAVAAQSRQDLAGSPAMAMPELLQRLARFRLTDLITK